MGFRCKCGHDIKVPVGFGMEACEKCKRYVQDDGTEPIRKQMPRRMTRQERQERNDTIAGALGMLRNGEINQEDYDQIVNDLRLI